MNGAIFPLQFANPEWGLLTAIVLGFLFGFALERGGFGNARKLAAQFYLYDMTVFKVMFTAILVAMVGLYTLVGLGYVSLDLIWINQTFVWGQLVGGFLLGVGFIMSGLCPGTCVVSAASGRWDAVSAILGVFVGVGIFAVAMGLFPPLVALYNAGSMDVSLLHNLFGVNPLVFALGVVVVAGAGFIGAEKVEEIFANKYEAVELTPPSRPRLKLGLVGGLAAVALLGLGVRPSAPDLPPIQAATIQPLTLAEEMIARTPGLLILDVRPDAETTEDRIPGSYPATTPEAAEALLATAPAGATVVLVDEAGTPGEIPPSWRRNVTYRYLENGFSGWTSEVLTPADPGTTQSERTWAARQGQIAAYFSGAAVQMAEVAAPPPMAGAGGEKPKKKGGC